MRFANPWKKLGSRLIYENAWLRLREDQVIRPDGKEGIYSVIDTRVATGVVALTPEREVYLIGQFRYPTNVYSWEIVEGGADPHETPINAAKRELQEEAGLIASNWRQLGGEVHLSNCISSEVAVFFVAEDLRETDKSPEETEVLEVKKVPLAEALRMVDAGEVQDAMSIIGLQRAERVLRR